jgi:hypothetical protein
MKSLFYKFMPWISGLLLGWLMFNPPAWLQSLGSLSYLINGALCGLLLLSVIAWIIIANLPARLTLEPVPDQSIHPELRDCGQRFQALGFHPIGTPRRVNVAPAAILLGYVHRSEPVYATAFRTEHVKPRLGFDYVSLLHGDKGGLTTNADPDGATLPAGSGGLRQVFPGECQEDLFQRHLEGIAYLREQGIECRLLSAETFEQDFSAAMARQRRMFLDQPLRFTLITLWRSATKQIPFMGTLREQKIARQQIAQLLVSL